MKKQLWVSALFSVLLVGQCFAVDYRNPLYENCSNYAHTAVDDQYTNARRHCGYSGPRWNNDFNAHYRWCQAVGLEQRNFEGIERQRCSLAVHALFAKTMLRMRSGPTKAMDS